MVASNNEYMTSTVEALYLSNSDENIRKVARERDDFLRYQAHREERIKKQEAEIESLTSENESLTSENKNLTSEIERLRKLLEENGINLK